MSNIPRSITRRACMWLVVVSAIAPTTYALIQGYLALLMVPTLQTLGVQSEGGLQAVFLSFSVIGAALAAALLSFMLTLLAKQGSALLGLLLGVITVAALLALQSWSASASATREVIEYTAFVLICGAASQMFGRKHAKASA